MNHWNPMYLDTSYVSQSQRHYVRESAVSYGSLADTAGSKDYIVPLFKSPELEAIGSALITIQHISPKEHASALDWLESNQKLLKRYIGKWVAFTPLRGIIAYGEDAAEVFEKAYIKDPTIVMHYVPPRKIELMF